MRRRATGRFELDLTPHEAIELFTPEGERAWAPDWNPLYIDGEPTETPGTVFITDLEGTQTIWVIDAIDRKECEVAYSRVTADHTAGTVRVTCRKATSGRCTVSVTYDMSILPGADPVELAGYSDRSFSEMMDHWRHHIVDSL